jgi:hypothetical protein
MAGATYAMPERMHRGGLLVRGALLLGSGGALAALAPRADAAGIPDGDLAYLRLLIAVELLKIDYGARAVVGKRLNAPTERLVNRLVLDDKRHYDGLAALMSNAGQTPATGGDVDFAYPRGSFDSAGAVGRLGRRLTMLATGAYLGALGNLQTPQLRLPLAQIAANEAQQAGAFCHLLGGHVVGSAFAPALEIDAVSSTLDEFEN